MRFARGDVRDYIVSHKRPRTFVSAVCTKNPIRVNDVMESLKLAE